MDNASYGKTFTRLSPREQLPTEPDQNHSYQWQAQILIFQLLHFKFHRCCSQGIVNGIPRSAIHFSTMYFQYCSIPDWWASFIVSSSWIAAMVVAPVIGYTGDYIHSRYPHHGRQCLAQVCIIARCILMTAMLTCEPREAQSLWIFVVLAVLIGFLAGWPGVGVNRPILTEIVHPEHRATTFALVSEVILFWGWHVSDVWRVYI